MPFRYIGQVEEDAEGNLWLRLGDEIDEADAEGQGVRYSGLEQAEDAEGHGRNWPFKRDDDDAEGHWVRFKVAPDDEDAEGQGARWGLEGRRRRG